MNSLPAISGGLILADLSLGFRSLGFDFCLTEENAPLLGEMVIQELVKNC